jgi:hypothetical protein
MLYAGTKDAIKKALQVRPRLHPSPSQLTGISDLTCDFSCFVFRCTIIGSPGRDSGY